MVDAAFPGDGYTATTFSDNGGPTRSVRGSDGGRSLVLNGHLDTVGVAGMDDPFSGHIKGDRLFGRGACDMKAGVAAMVVAATSAPALAGDVVPALVADEEDQSIGTEAVLRHLAGRLSEAGGVPTVVCGPAGGGLHSPVEWVELTQLRTYTRALTQVLADFCGLSERTGPR